MKKYSFLCLILTVLFLCLSINAQTPKNSPQPAPTVETKKEQKAQEKQNKIDEKKVKEFAHLFQKSYYQTFDLTKTPKSFLINNFKKRNIEDSIGDEFDKELTNAEKFQFSMLMMDFTQLNFILKLQEAGFDFNKAFITNNSNNANDLNSFLSDKVKILLFKYKKTSSLIQGQDSYKFKDVNDIRETMSDFQKVNKKLRLYVNSKIKENYSKFLNNRSDKLFNFQFSFECFKDRNFCDGIPDKTQMYYYNIFPLTLLIAKDKNQLKIVKIMPISD